MGRRIVITHRSTVDSVGGVNTFIFELASALIRLGDEVRIVTYSGNKPKEFFSEMYDVPLAEVPDIVRLDEKSPTWPPKTSFKDMVVWFFRGSEEVYRRHPDLVVVNGVVPLRKPVNSCMVVAVNHGIVTGSTPERIAVGLLYKLVCNGVVGVSGKVVRGLNSYYNIRPERIVRIPVCLNVRRLTSSYPYVPFEERENAIIHVGTYETKNLATTLRAFKSLSKRLGFQTRLYIAGPYYDWAARMVSELEPEIRDLVEYHGLVSKVELMRLLGVSKAVVMPSMHAEGFGYGILEAMCVGTPSVVSRSIPEDVVIDNYNGFVLNDAHDSEGLSRYVELLLSNKSLWERISRNSVSYATKFDSERIAKMYLKLAD